MEAASAFYAYFCRVSKKKTKAPPPPRGPLLLALETATGVSSVAVFESDRLLAQLDFHADRLHARLMTVLVQQALDNLQIPITEMAAIVVSQGPGSYTGLRVGVSTAKGLAMALDLPLISVGSLEALAHSVTDLARAKDAWICPMIDARRMEVYCALYDAEGKAQTAVEAKIMEEGAFAEELAERKILFVGDGAAKCAPLLETHPHATVLPKRLSSAAWMGKPAWKKFQDQDFEDLVRFEPFYLKNFVATISKKKTL